MTQLESIRKALHPVSPYASFDVSAYPLDVSGWGGEEPVFRRLLAEAKPELVIEVGTWKGASAIHMAHQMPVGGVLCVDTWLGALEFWQNTADRERYQALKLVNGYPSVYYQFLANVVRSGLTERIVPFPVTSPIAARWCRSHSVQPGLVYIDASHDEADVQLDLEEWWPVVERGGGTLFGHDYPIPGVRAAVDRFAAARGLYVELDNAHWIYRR